MARKSHPMSLVSMLVLLVAIVALVPWILRTLIRTVSGFEDAPSVNSVPSVTTMGSGMRYVPDRNTDYLCRSPNDNGVPCPEGEFCDGTTQSCQKKSVASTNMVTGYFA